MCMGRLWVGRSPRRGIDGRSRPENAVLVSVGELCCLLRARSVPPQGSNRGCDANSATLNPAYAVFAPTQTYLREASRCDLPDNRVRRRSLPVLRDTDPGSTVRSAP